GEDDGEQVIEVVGDAARELADRLHLLRLAQLVLQHAPLGHVLRERLEAIDRAVAPPQRPAAQPHKDLPAVPALPRDLDALHGVAVVEPSDHLGRSSGSAYTSRAMS